MNTLLRITLYLAVFTVGGVPTALNAQISEKVITIPSVPATMEEFTALRDKIASEPEGGAAVFVTAMLMYARNAELGTHMFTVALDRSRLSESARGYKGFVPSPVFMNYPKSYLAPKPYLANSYFMNTSPENGYALPPPPLEVAVSRNTYSDQGNGDIKVFIQCSGADSPRPVILRQNNRGLWKAVNVNSLFVGIRPPVSVVEDDL